MYKIAIFLRKTTEDCLVVAFTCSYSKKKFRFKVQQLISINLHQMVTKRNSYNNTYKTCQRRKKMENVKMSGNVCQTTTLSYFMLLISLFAESFNTSYLGLGAV